MIKLFHMDTHMDNIIPIHSKAIYYTWQPDEKTVANANITSALRQLNLANYTELLTYSTKNLSTFIDYFLKKQIVFKKNYAAIGVNPADR